MRLVVGLWTVGVFLLEDLVDVLAGGVAELNGVVLGSVAGGTVCHDRHVGVRVGIDDWWLVAVACVRVRRLVVAAVPGCAVGPGAGSRVVGWMARAG